MFPRPRGLAMPRMPLGLMPLQRPFMAPGAVVPMCGGPGPSPTQLKHRTEEDELKDLELLLNKKTYREKQNTKTGEELLDLIHRPTAKETAVAAKFKTKGGSQLKEYCTNLTKEDCRRQTGSFVACEKVTGGRSTVRKGLIALASCLQGDQPAGSSNSGKKDGSMLPWASSEMTEPRTGTFCSEASREHQQSSVPQFDWHLPLLHDFSSSWRCWHGSIYHERIITNCKSRSEEYGRATEALMWIYKPMKTY